MLIDRLIDKIKEKDNPSVAGLDTCIDYLPDDVRGKCETLYDAAKYITDFNFALIDAILCADRRDQGRRPRGQGAGRLL